MPEFTKRHLLVSRLVVLSLGMAGLFGVASVLFALAQNRFSSALDSKQSIAAFELSVDIDTEYLVQGFKASAVECDPVDIQSCTKLIASMAMVKNRLEDYRILFVKTLDYANNSQIVSDLSDFSSEVDNSAKRIFGLSLKEAASLGLLSPEAMIAHAAEMQTFNLQQIDFDNALLDLRTDFVDRIFNRLDQELKVIDQADVSIAEKFIWLRRVFFFVFAVEVLIFLLVNGIDIVNNNADPDRNFEFTFQKIQPKVRPLVLSLAFAFVAMLAGQYLLYREGKLNYLDSCRSLNKQNIGFFNSIESYSDPDVFLPLHSKFLPPQYCSELIEDKLAKPLSSLPAAEDSSASIKQQILGYKLRLYADAYQDSLSVLSEETQWYLFSILIFNVASLTVMSVFLRYDSKDIG